MSLADQLREQRRLVILQGLAEDNQRTLSDTALCTVLRYMAHSTPRDVLRTDLRWLEEQSLVRVERRPDGQGDDLWIATLSREGLEVVEGRQHPGVMRPKPR